jgi:hypothetical protein
LLLALLVPPAALSGCEEQGPCDAGTEGCPCLDDGSCRLDALSCVSDVCVAPVEVCDEDGACRSIVPRCFTPCSGPLTEPDGTHRSCSDEGLMEGCLSGSVCDRGSCVPEAMLGGGMGSAATMSDAGSVPPVDAGITADGGVAVTAAALGNGMDGHGTDPGECARETDCPDFQTCIEGRCYSECINDDECSDGRSCVRTVCRTTCREDARCEDPEHVCVDGVCLPAVTPGEAPGAAADGNFSLSEQWIQLTANVTTGEFVIRNETSSSQLFTVRKAEEVVVEMDGTSRVRRRSEGDEPLPWLELGEGAAERKPFITVIVPAGGESTVQIAGARNPELSRWTGSLEVVHERLGSRSLRLSYSDLVDGRWVGTVHYFGNFDDGARPDEGRDPLAEWTEDRSNIALLDQIPNAFLQAWGRFRNNALSLVEMQALVSTTLQGTWQTNRVEQLCEEAGYGPSAVCAPFGGSGSQNVLLYSSAGDVNRVPSGSVELQFAMNVRQATPSELQGDARCDGTDHCFVGKIDSSSTLQYGGDPEVVLHFEDDPLSCASSGAAGCIARLARLDAEVALGGRYLPAPEDTACTEVDGLEPMVYPWLVPGFMPAGVAEGLAGEGRTRRECRDTVVPFLGDVAANKGYAAANPVPDGRTRKRKLSLVDALMVEQHTMLAILRETLQGPEGTPQASSYAYAILEKEPEDPQPDELQGSRVEDDRPEASGLLSLSCDDDLIREVTGRPRTRPIEELSDDELRDLARAVVRGDTSSVNSPPLPTAESDDESVHYLCLWREEAVQNDNDLNDEPALVQREVFDAGADGAVNCPPGATVFYFALDDDEFGAGFDPAAEPCNAESPETCLGTLESWVVAGTGIRLTDQARTTFTSAPADFPFDLVYRCETVGEASCDPNARDLREGKIFFAADLPEVFFNPIETDIREAFRYKTQFVSRSGRNVGFAPEICQGSGNLVPYCYDPTLIEDVVERIDCALAIYHLDLEEGRFDPLDSDDADTIDTLRLYLEKNFGVLQRFNPLGDPVVESGFERLYAELLIMLGDEAYTQAFASRFDLAGSNLRAFEGERFEAAGLSLSGAAGYEMYVLHQAAQYYGMALDRFFRLSGLLSESLRQDSSRQYVSQETVTSYLNRVTRASTQTAAAYSEIARRYQSLNRPDLARRVLERAYTRAYQESVILSDFMTDTMRAVSPAAVAQVVGSLEDAQRRYRVAMLDMHTAYNQITDDLNFFGLRQDFIPFPALDEDDVNGFEVMFERARETAAVAGEAEQKALEGQREFDVDQAVFQSELVSIRNNYEAQLGELCGTFEGVDGRIYPAVTRYAHLSPELAQLDDPCGAAGNGAIWLKVADLQTRNLELQRVRQEVENLRQQFLDARDWVATQCQLIQEDVLVFLQKQRAVDGAERSIDSLELSIGILDKVLAFVDGITDRGDEPLKITTPWGKLGAVALTSIWAGATATHFVSTTILESRIDAKQREIRELERNYEAYTIGRQCDYLTAELVYTLRDIQRDMALAEIDVLDAVWNVQVDLANLDALSNERRRIEAEWEDAEQITINVAAAQNDPNIRIYKNDAIITADRTFRRAMRSAYRATRIYEYYTASSYADYEKLFLIRMINAGDINLNEYLDDLEDAFFAYEDQFGNPDTRVMQISVRDDIFEIPRYAVDGSNRILTTEERAELFREKLQDPSLLDDEGMLAVRFSTDFEQLSPRTANHKILFTEVDVYGDTGDSIGRVYLQQVGTGVVSTLEGDRDYYTFPEQSAVMNPVFNGDRSLGQDSDGAIAGPTRSIYRSYRFRERPLVQTNWELILNQRTESVNEDINLAGLDDIVLSVFYTDFTP